MRRRRPRHVEDESYFVSMTDLMIGLLFIFIIMLMSFAINFRMAQNSSEAARDNAVRQAGAAAAQATALARTNERLTDNDATMRFILEVLAAKLREAGVPVRVFPEVGVLRLPERVLFDSGRAELKPEAITAVAVLARELGALLPCFTSLVRGGPTPRACPPDRHGRVEALVVE